MMSKIWITLLLVAAIAIVIAGVGCGGSDAEGEPQAAAADSTTAEKNEKPEGQKGKDKGKEPPKIEAVPVEVTTVSVGNITSSILLSSSVESEEMVDVYPQVMGIVEQLFVEEGDKVSKGAPLLQVHDEEYALAEQGAKVSYQRQKQALERAEAMFKKELLSQDEIENARYAAEEARIAWEQAKYTLKHARVRAPISGVVAERTVRLGDRILTSNKVYSIVNTGKLVARVRVPETDAMACRVGQTAYITSDALGSRRIRGKVDRISPVVDPRSGTVKVTVAANDHSGGLRPGMFVNVHLVTADHKDVPMVPKKAVVYDDNALFVYVVRADSLARRIQVNPGFEDAQRLEALAGVTSGDTIIVVGQSGMRDSTRVKIVNWDTKGTGD